MFVRSDSSGLTFEPDGNGGYINPGGYGMTLTRLEDGWTLEELDRTRYTYDAMGNLVSMTNAKLETTTYTYDLAGNMTPLTSPMGRTESYTYYTDSAVSARLTAKGDTIRYDYDKLNDLVEKSYETALEEDAQNPVRFRYNEMGQRISMTDITGTTTYTYDSLGRLATVTSGSGKQIVYTYDEANNLASITYPDGLEVSYEYDKNDNITKVIDRSAGETTYTYDALNRMTEMVRPNGIRTTYTYNAKDQLVELRNLCSCGFLISSYTYEYNDSGYISKEVAKECLYTSEKDYGHKDCSANKDAHAVSNPWQNQNPVWETTTRTFEYDAGGQLTKCVESKSAFKKITYLYTYDEVGNRLTARKQELYKSDQYAAYTYNADNQMVEATYCDGRVKNTYTYEYDANGNMTAESRSKCSQTTYQYDVENRLTAVYDKQKLLAAYCYDGDGERVFALTYNPESVGGYGKNISGEVYAPDNMTDADGNLTAEGELFSYINCRTGRTYDLTEYVNDVTRQYTDVLYEQTNGHVETYHTYGNQRISSNRIQDAATKCQSSVTGYYQYDNTSVTSASNEAGMVTGVYQYTPYGGVTLGGGEYENFYAYNGENYNPGTGLEYLCSRYYDTSKGRFITEDTYLGDIYDPLTLNRYAYAKNNPVNYIDPSGHVASASRFAMSTLDGGSGKISSKNSKAMSGTRYELKLASGTARDIGETQPATFSEYLVQTSKKAAKPSMSFAQTSTVSKATGEIGTKISAEYCSDAKNTQEQIISHWRNFTDAWHGTMASMSGNMQPQLAGATVDGTVVGVSVAAEADGTITAEALLGAMQRLFGDNGGVEGIVNLIICWVKMEPRLEEVKTQDKTEKRRESMLRIRHPVSDLEIYIIMNPTIQNGDMTRIRGNWWIQVQGS